MIQMIPNLAQTLKEPEMTIRKLLRFFQIRDQTKERRAYKGKLLLVNTPPLHIRTVFGKVVDELLPKGVHHTTASILQPDTTASGDIYELYGNTLKPLKTIPLELNMNWRQNA